MKKLILIVLLLSSPALSSCAGNAQPVLTPAGQAAVTATQVIRALDVVRDTAILLNAQTPPVLSEHVTLQIITVHESAVKTILAVPAGWKPTVLTALEQLQRDLAPADWSRIEPYVTLVHTLIAQVP